MTLQNLKYILEISNNHSFSRAAKNLFVSQSTLSAAVKELEADLGISIFKRTNRGVTLTYDGEDFIKYAREIVEQSQYLEQRYHSRKSLPMRFSVSCQHLPSAVRAFTIFLEEINSKRVLVDFYATWCGPCKMLGLVLEKLNEKDIIPILKVDTDESEALANKYNIFSVPTLIIFENGKEIKRQTGYMSYEELERWVTE